MVMALERLVGGARPNGVWSSEVSDNLNGVQRDRNNLKIIVGHPLYIDLGSVDRGDYFPEQKTLRVEPYHWSQGLLSKCQFVDGDAFNPDSIASEAR
jgi:hypothetical protein